MKTKEKSEQQGYLHSLQVFCVFKNASDILEASAECYPDKATQTNDSLY